MERRIAFGLIPWSSSSSAENWECVVEAGGISGRRNIGAALIIQESVFSQIAFCDAMVASVSPNCTRTEESRASSLSFSLQAIVLASAVISAVSSHGVISIILIHQGLLWCSLKNLDKSEIVYMDSFADEAEKDIAGSPSRRFLEVHLYTMQNKCCCLLRQGLPMPEVPEFV